MSVEGGNFCGFAPICESFSVKFGGVASLVAPATNPQKSFPENHFPPIHGSFLLQKFVL